MKILCLKQVVFFMVLGKACSVDATCEPQDCTVGDWTQWSECTTDCGSTGTKTRVRMDIILQSCGGVCKQELFQVEACNRGCQNGGQPASASCSCSEGFGGTCCEKVHGGWSNFSSWSDCTVTCGGGIKKRQRTCTNPVPSNGGDECVGDKEETEECNKQECLPKVHGGWSDFSSWSDCTVTCGGGIKKRQRTCTNPVPSNGGDECVGDEEETEECNKQECLTKVHGGWSNFSSWSDCTVTCGRGTKKRQRTCTNPVPSNGGDECVGDEEETEECNNQECLPKVDGGWSDYSEWTECSVTCDGGTMKRTRTCTNPTPSNGGETCIGEPIESKYCNTRQCVTQAPACNNPLVWGAGRDTVLSSSSMLDTTHTPYKSPLNSKSSWCASVDDDEPFLQVNLGSVQKIERVATRGDSDNDDWVKQYKLVYSVNGKYWVKYGNEKIFSGNTDSTSIVMNELLQPVQARYVRILPDTWNQASCMRMELYGCSDVKTPQFTPLGCFKDRRKKPTFQKMLVSFRNNKSNNSNLIIQACADAAYTAGYQYFSVQNYGDCRADHMNDRLRYEKYGSSTKCSSGMGGPSANFVYVFGNSEFPSHHIVIPKFNPIGCYKDKRRSRALPVLLGNHRGRIDWSNMNKTIDVCARLAAAGHYDYFAIEFYGECWSSKTAGQTYSRYGSSTRCWNGVGSKMSLFVYKFDVE